MSPVTIIEPIYLLLTRKKTFVDFLRKAPVAIIGRSPKVQQLEKLMEE